MSSPEGMPPIEENPYVNPEHGPVYELSDNVTQIALAKQWFKLHPELYEEVQSKLSSEDSEIKLSDIIRVWTGAHAKASEIYRDFVELKSKEGMTVDISDEDALSAILRDMGLLKTYH